jgi:hypothetical protein
MRRSMLRSRSWSADSVLRHRQGAPFRYNLTEMIGCIRPSTRTS